MARAASGVLRAFEDREEAERARAWLERSDLTAVCRDTGDGRPALEVPAGQHQRADGVLEAPAGMEHLADLPLAPRWLRILAWENLAALVGAAVAVLLAWAAWTAADRLIPLPRAGDGARPGGGRGRRLFHPALAGFAGREFSGQIWAQVRMR